MTFKGKEILKYVAGAFIGATLMMSIDKLCDSNAQAFLISDMNGDDLNEIVVYKSGFNILPDKRDLLVSPNYKTVKQISPELSSTLKYK